MISAPTFKRANRAEPTDMRRFMRDNRVKHYFLCNAYPRKAIVTVSRADDIRPYSGDRTGMVLATPYRAKLRIAGCQFLRKVGNSGILCETRREVLRTRERTSVRDRTGMVLATPYRAKLRIAGCQFLRKVGNSGILCETRREVLRTRERTSVRDRTGMVLATPYRAKLRIAGCQFLRKVGNSGILCETRREVLRTRERTSVRDQVLRFSQRRIARNYALPT